jgi:hypothetical protein
MYVIEFCARRLEHTADKLNFDGWLDAITHYRSDFHDAGAAVRRQYSTFGLAA